MLRVYPSHQWNHFFTIVKTKQTIGNALNIFTINVFNQDEQSSRNYVQYKKFKV